MKIAPETEILMRDELHEQGAQHKPPVNFEIFSRIIRSHPELLQGIENGTFTDPDDALNAYASISSKHPDPRVIHLRSISK